MKKIIILIFLSLSINADELNDTLGIILEVKSCKFLTITKNNIEKQLSTRQISSSIIKLKLKDKKASYTSDEVEKALNNVFTQGGLSALSTVVEERLKQLNCK